MVHRKYDTSMLSTRGRACPGRLTFQYVPLLAPAAGDDVALTEGEWEMLYLFRREGPSPEAGQDPVLHLAGYMTVFSFSSPIKGKCPRVCQALILPPYQRQGECS